MIKLKTLLEHTGFVVDKSSRWIKLCTEGVENDDVVFGGIWSSGRIVANIVSRKSEGYYGHTRDMGHNRWTYYQETGVVFWWSFPPDEDKKHDVEDWLSKHGYVVKEHRDRKTYYEFMASFYKKKNSNEPIAENVEEPVIIGAIKPDGRIVAINGDAHIDRHPSDMRSDLRWRYYPELQQLDWWEKPTDKESELVKIYLGQKGFEIKRVNNLTSWDFRFNSKNKQRSSDPFGPDAIAENELLMEERAKPKDLEAFLREMIRGSEWEGKVFLVGGFVRDELLGKEPKDADIVVGKYQGGVELTTWLGKKLGIYKEGSNPVIFPTFGTANLRLDGVVWNGIDFTGESVDAVMFRKEQYHDPSTRKPTVQFTPDIAVDASRRDLTFNALYKDVSNGNIIDPTGNGIEDLKNKIVRTPIDPTIIYTDDALRMFRAVRFATQLGFNLAPEIIDGIKNNLHRLNNTSKERVRDELNKILLSKDPRRGFQLLRDTGLLPHISPDLQRMVGMTQNVHHKHDVFEHTMEVLMGTNPEIVRRLMALFHDIGKTVTRTETPTGVHFIGHEDAGPDIVEKIMMELKYPRALIDAVKLGVRHHMKLKHGKDDAVKLSDKSLRKFKIAVGEYLEHILDVIHADNIAHADASAMPNQIEKVRARLKTLNVQVSKPNLPINGNDSIELGVNPGPQIGKILTAITDAWYENPNITREQALAIVQQML